MKSVKIDVFEITIKDELNNTETVTTVRNVLEVKNYLESSERQALEDKVLDLQDEIYAKEE